MDTGREASKSQTIYRINIFKNTICMTLTTAFISGAEAVKINVWLSATEK